MKSLFGDDEPVKPGVPAISRITPQMYPRLHSKLDPLGKPVAEPAEVTLDEKLAELKSAAEVVRTHALSNPSDRERAVSEALAIVNLITKIKV